MKVSKNSPQNNLEIVTNEHNKEIPKERYIPSEKKKEIIDELRFKQYNNGTSAKSQKLQKIRKKIIQKQLQMRMIKKYLKKDIHLQEKDKKLVIILILI